MKPVLATIAFLLAFGFSLSAAEPVTKVANPPTRSVQQTYVGAASPVTEALSLESDQPTILEFSATWCGPCKEMKPEIDKLKVKNYPIRVLDVDQEQDLAHTYRVSAIPAFIIVDPSGKMLGRSEGLQDASKLASQFRRVKADWQVARSKAEQQVAAASDIPENSDDQPAVGANSNAVGHHPSFGEPGETEDSAKEAAHPKPWQTVVRIVVHGGGVMGFGSGTIIESTDNHSLILTCAHIFKIDNARNQYRPSEFPRQVTVDLFDGKLAGEKGQQVKTAVKNIPARVIDYDFQNDVGIIAISPGYKLPFSPVVPENWKPANRMTMITAGCSGGRDATVWNTEVVNPDSRMMIGGQHYEAIECLHEPIQGRSGGGLFTLDGYVAGVCDMAVVGQKRGLYATPKSIHALLARNEMGRLYKRQLDGMDKGQMLARADAPRRSPKPYVRAQGNDDVTIPPPSLLGVTDPNSAGLPPVGSLAMVDAMTETPLRTVPNAGKGWNGGSQFRKISESAADSPSDGVSIPKARRSGEQAVALADTDLVPVNQLGSSDEADPALVGSKSSPNKARVKSVSNPETQLADAAEAEKPATRKASSSSVDRQPPRVRLMPVQGLEKSNEGQWRGNMTQPAMD